MQLHRVIELTDRIATEKENTPAKLVANSSGLEYGTFLGVIENLQQIPDGSASDQPRESSVDACHRRVQIGLEDDSLVTVEIV